MKNRWILFIFPTAGLLFLIFGYLFFGGWLKIASSGDKRDAVIEAIIYERSEGVHDLLHRIDHKITLTRENGLQMVVSATDAAITSIQDGDELLDLSDGVMAALGGNEELMVDLQKIIRDTNDRIQWFMLRQSRLEESTRFVSLEKEESAYFYTNLNEGYSLSVNSDGSIFPQSSALNESLVETYGLFSYEDQDALDERKGDHLVEYSISQDGEVIDSDKTQFILHNEPYDTLQFPVFAFDYDGATYAVMSDIGKHGSPSQAFALGAEVTALFEPTTPASALILGKVGPREPGEPFLNWFSKLCEIYMNRWIYPGIFMLGAFMCFLSGAIFISMVTHPAKRLPPVPEETK